MNNLPRRRKNHFVPRLYLKRFATAEECVWVYRTLVSNEKVPFWKQKAISRVATQPDLYTSVTSEGQSDELEKWLDQEFEAPAEESLRKATSGERLSPTDWEHLVRFFAAQDVRTPARYYENQRRMDEWMPGLIDKTLKESIREIESAGASGQDLVVRDVPYAGMIPAKFTREFEPGRDSGRLGLHVLAGRALWLFTIKNLLVKTAAALHQHRWTILSPPPGEQWFTSDDPAIRLNCYSKGQYDFRGGWGSPGTDLMLPLSPNHLLYTQVGHRPPARGEKALPAFMSLTRRFVAEHAHRMIFSLKPDPEVATLRPRVVDAVAYRSEELHWKNWHLDQTTAEKKFVGDKVSEP